MGQKEVIEQSKLMLKCLIFGGMFVLDNVFQLLNPMPIYFNWGKLKKLFIGIGLFTVKTVTRFGKNCNPSNEVIPLFETSTRAVVKVSFTSNSPSPLLSNTILGSEELEL